MKTADCLELERGDGYCLSTDPARLDIDAIYAYLSQVAYWAQGRSRETVEASIAHSLCYGLYWRDPTGNGGERQVGFARVITDKATFAYLCDVFVVDAHQGWGLGKWLVQSVATHLDGFGIRRQMLATRDAHELYARYAGFEPMSTPEMWMIRIRG